MPHIPVVPLALLLSCERNEPVETPAATPELSAKVSVPVPTPPPDAVVSPPTVEPVPITPTQQLRAVPPAAEPIAANAVRAREYGNVVVHGGNDDATHGPALAPGDRIVSARKSTVRLVEEALETIDGAPAVEQVSSAIRRVGGGVAVYAIYESAAEEMPCIDASDPGVAVECSDPELPISYPGEAEENLVDFATLTTKCTRAALVHAELNRRGEGGTAPTVTIADRIPLPSFCRLDPLAEWDDLAIVDIDADGHREVLVTWSTDLEVEVLRGNQTESWADRWVGVFRLDLGVQWIGRLGYHEQHDTNGGWKRVFFGRERERGELIVDAAVYDDQDCPAQDGIFASFEFPSKARCPIFQRTRWIYAPEIDRWRASTPRTVGAR